MQIIWIINYRSNREFKQEFLRDRRQTGHKKKLARSPNHQTLVFSIRDLPSFDASNMSFSNSELLILQRTRAAVQQAKQELDEKDQKINQLEAQLAVRGGNTFNSAQNQATADQKDQIIVELQNKIKEIIASAQQDKLAAVQKERNSVTKNLATLKLNLEKFVKQKNETENRLKQTLLENEKLRQEIAGQNSKPAAQVNLKTAKARPTPRVQKAEEVQEQAVARPVAANNAEKIALAKQLIQAELKRNEQHNQEIQEIKNKLILVHREEANLKGALESQKRVIDQQSAVIFRNSGSKPGSWVVPKQQAKAEVKDTQPERQTSGVAAWGKIKGEC